jgi:hypothetical protein
MIIRHMIDHHISWTTIFFMIIQQIFLFHWWLYLLGYHIFHIKIWWKFNNKKFHWRQGSLPENNKTFNKIPTLFQHYWFYRLQSNFLSLFIYFSTFVMLSHWWSHTRRFSHIWLYTRYETRNLLKCFYIMATWPNNVLKHGKVEKMPHGARWPLSFTFQVVEKITFSFILGCD